MSPSTKSSISPIRRTGQGRQPMHDEATVAQCVKRYIQDGESVSVLAKYYKAAKPTVYSWIKKHEEMAAEAARTKGMTTQGLEDMHSRDLRVINKQLEEQNEKLRKKLLELMIKTGEL